MKVNILIFSSENIILSDIYVTDRDGTRDGEVTTERELADTIKALIEDYYSTE